MGNIPQGTQQIEDGQYDGRYQSSQEGFTGDLIIPEGVIKIGEEAFYSNVIVTLHLPDSLKYIGKGAFAKTL